MANKFLSFLILTILYSCINGQENKTSTELHPKEFKIKMQERPGLLIDVRTPEEFSAGHLKGAININFYDEKFIAKINSLTKEEPIYVYCASGGRSAKAQEIINDLGIKDVTNLLGGYKAWSAKGLEIEK